MRYELRCVTAILIFHWKAIKSEIKQGNYLSPRNTLTSACVQRGLVSGLISGSVSLFLTTSLSLFTRLRCFVFVLSGSGGMGISSAASCCFTLTIGMFPLQRHWGNHSTGLGQLVRVSCEGTSLGTFMGAKWLHKSLKMSSHFKAQHYLKEKKFYMTDQFYFISFHHKVTQIKPQRLTGQDWILNTSEEQYLRLKNVTCFVNVCNLGPMVCI